MFFDLVNEFVLTESISEGVAAARRKYVRPGVLGASFFEELVKSDPSRNKKYIEWMCKIEIEENLVYDRLIQAVKDFDRLASKGYLENTDIYKYKTLKEVEDVLTLPKNKESLRKLKREKELDIEKILDNEDFLVIFPKTSEAMAKYGKGTKWCVTDETVWDDYTFHSYFKMYIVINKKPLSFKIKFYPISSKFVVLVKIDADLVIIYDDEDNILSVFDKKQFLNFMNFDNNDEAKKKLFKPFTEKELENLKS